MQHILQVTPILDKLKHLQQALSYKINLSTSQKVSFYFVIKFCKSAIQIFFMTQKYFYIVKRVL